MAAKATTAMETTTTVSKPLFAKLCADLQNARPEKTQEKNKDLQKTRMCTYYLQGKCGLGSNCKFAHNKSEIREAPNLSKTGLCINFMKGNCQRDNCTFAHGEAELVKPPSYKKTMCIWFRQGKCRNGNSCGFVHDLAELTPEVDHTTPVPLPLDHITPAPSPSRKVSLLSAPVSLRPMKPWAKPNPVTDIDVPSPAEHTTPVPSSSRKVSLLSTPVSLRPMRPWAKPNPVTDINDKSTAKPDLVSDDDNASTAAPSESQAETASTDVSGDEAKPMPNEHLFRVMAGRGSAPQDQQLRSMSLAIAQLQKKLSQLKARQEAVSDQDETLRNQIKELEYAIGKLSKQIQRTEAELRGEKDPVAQWRDGMISRDEFLAGRTVSLQHPLAHEPGSYSLRTAARSDHRPCAKGTASVRMRMALGVLALAAMVLVEVTLPSLPF